MPERYAIYLPDGKKLSLPMALKTRRSLESARSWLYGKHQLEKPPVPWEELRIVDLTKEEPPMTEEEGSMEYAIWGKPPGAAEETLLLAQPGGRPITDPEEAQKLMGVLVKKHGCTDCRIQTIDMENPDMSGFEKSVREDDSDIADIKRRAGITEGWISTNWDRDQFRRAVLRMIEDNLFLMKQLREAEVSNDPLRQQGSELVEEIAQKLVRLRQIAQNLK